MAAADGGAAAARLRWELENQIAPATDADLYVGDPSEQQQLQQQKPWAKDPHFFKHVRISALALLKMAMHARSGGQIEVMGLLQGRAQADGTFVVLDCFALPVEGTETRVNAQAEAYEYMVAFVDASRKAGKGATHNVVGWYHSHPGYGCWLSGIDVGTQMLNQTYQEPWLAVVVDPVRTMASGKVELGAFRTYPEGYTAPSTSTTEDDGYQTIPLSKIEDFGVHARHYYPLSVSYFKSALDGALVDLLWRTHWAHALAQSPLIAGRSFAAGQIADVAEKLAAAEGAVAQGAARARYAAALGGGGGGGGGFGVGGLGSSKGKGGGGKEEGGSGSGGAATAAAAAAASVAGATGPLSKICRDANRLSAEQIKGMASQVVKQLLFNAPPTRLLAVEGGGGGGGAVVGAAAGAEPMES